LQTIAENGIAFVDVQDGINGCSLKGSFEFDPFGGARFPNCFVIGSDDVIGPSGEIDFGKRYVVTCDYVDNCQTVTPEVNGLNENTEVIIDKNVQYDFTVYSDDTFETIFQDGDT